MMVIRQKSAALLLKTVAQPVDASEGHKCD